MCSIWFNNLWNVTKAPQIFLSPFKCSKGTAEPKVSQLGQWNSLVPMLYGPQNVEDTGHFIQKVKLFWFHVPLSCFE